MLKISVMLMGLFSVVACQQLSVFKQTLSGVSVMQNTSLGEYYLWLTRLDNNQLVSQKSIEQSSLTKGQYLAQYRMLLIQSLVNQPNLNQAAIQLTDLTKKSNSLMNKHKLDKQDEAFMTLFIQSQTIKLALLRQLQQQKGSAEYLEQQLKLQNDQMNLYKERVQKLEQQIIQLKDIERSINDHGALL